MSRPISPQHPAVVLRSHYVHLRALLAIAMVAVVGLTFAVVMLAARGDASSTSAAPASATPIPPAGVVQPPPGQRYDGGPDEGTRGSTAVPGPPRIRYDRGP
jgi:hypothetical protein